MNRGEDERERRSHDRPDDERHQGALTDAHDGDAFVRDVLARTSGSACGRCESLLGDYIDGALAREDAELLAEHLDHCSPCREVARAMAELRGPLRAMAAIDPGPEFTVAVLQATVGAHALGGSRLDARRSPLAAASPVAAASAVSVGTGPSSLAEPAPRRRRLPLAAGVAIVPALRAGGLAPRALWQRSCALWQVLSARPRFAVEAAYVGTLVLLLVFGTPRSPLGGLPAQAVQLAELNPVRGTVTVVRAVAERTGAADWQPFGDATSLRPVWEWPERQAGAIGGRWTALRAAAGRAHADGAYLVRAVRTRQLPAAGQGVQQLAQDLTHAWNILRGSAPGDSAAAWGRETPSPVNAPGDATPTTTTIPKDRYDSR